MNNEKFVYVTYIASTPEKVWQALMEGELTRQFWKSEMRSDWKVGSVWQHIKDDGKGTLEHVGEVLECVPNTRLVLTWVGPANAEDRAKYSTVGIDIEAAGAKVRLTVTHTKLSAEVLRGISYGWPLVLSNLKTLLETGSAFDF